MGEPLERSIYGRKENIQMAETLKEITENYEKLHRLQMIEMILKTTYDFVENTVREIVECFDNYEDFDDEATDIIIRNIKK